MDRQARTEAETAYFRISSCPGRLPLDLLLGCFRASGRGLCSTARWRFTLPAVAYAFGAACFDFVRVAERFVFGSTFDVSPMPVGIKPRTRIRSGRPSTLHPFLANLQFEPVYTGVSAIGVAGLIWSWR